MRTLFISILVLILVKSSYSQEDTAWSKTNHELGFGVTNILRIPSYDDLTNYYVWERYYFIYPTNPNISMRGGALIYKLSTLGGAFRLISSYAFDYQNKTTSRSDTGGVYPVNFKSDFSDARFQLGYQYNLKFEKLITYFGLDYFFIKRNNEIIINQYQKYLGQPYARITNQKNEDQPNGISLFLGFGYRFSKLISTNVESCVDFYSNQGTQRLTVSYEPILDKRLFYDSVENSKQKERGIRFRPLQLISLNLHF